MRTGAGPTGWNGFGAFPGMPAMPGFGGFPVMPAFGGFPAMPGWGGVAGRATTGRPRSPEAMLDALFYDVDVITDEETALLGTDAAPEGAVVVVPPTGQGTVRVYRDFATYAAADDPVTAVAVAGVASSALGGAALSRDVADAIGAPVAAVVSGHGLSDLAAEAMGGWFWYGGINLMRQAAKVVTPWSQLVGAAEDQLEASELVSFVRTSKDVDTLLHLIESDGSIELLVGHSKGNLMISEALYWLRANDPKRFIEVTEKTAVITLCAKVGMPAGCERVIDITGEHDSFGAMNSRIDIRSDHIVPNAWHSTSRQFPYEMGLDVTKAIRAVLPLLDGPLTDQRIPRRPNGAATGGGRSRTATGRGKPRASGSAAARRRS